MFKNFTDLLDQPVLTGVKSIFCQVLYCIISGLRKFKLVKKRKVFLTFCIINLYCTLPNFNIKCFPILIPYLII